MPTTKEPRFIETGEPPKPAGDGAPKQAAPAPGADPATSGDAPLVAPLAPAPDQSEDPAQPDMNQLNTATPPPAWPESTEVKSRPGEPGQGETDPALVPSGAVSPTPAG